MRNIKNMNTEISGSKNIYQPVFIFIKNTLHFFIRFLLWRNFIGEIFTNNKRTWFLLLKQWNTFCSPLIRSHICKVKWTLANGRKTFPAYLESQAGRMGMRDMKFKIISPVRCYYSASIQKTTCLSFPLKEMEIATSQQH